MDTDDSNIAQEADDKEPAAETEPAPENPPADAGKDAPAGPDWKEMYARTMADFDNFRKRTARDREECVKSAAAGVLKDVLATVDNLARAIDEAAGREDDPFVAGVRLTYEGLVKTLAAHGATPLDSKGEPFDANFHEAIAQVPSAAVPEGNVVDEVKRGWLLNGKLLRAAQVTVSSGAPAPAKEDD